MTSIKRKAVYAFGCTVFLLLGALGGIKVWAQNNEIVTNDIYDLLSRGYALKANVKEINYRYLPLNESSFFKREVKNAKVMINMVKERTAPRPFERTIELQPGERLANYFLSSGGHSEKQEASFLFYNDEQGLGSLFAEITSAGTKLDANGQLSYALIEGTWEENPSVKVSIERNNFKYDKVGNLSSYSSRFLILNSPSGLPGGSIDALTIHKIVRDPTTKKVTGVIFNHFYGPSVFWYLYNIQYDRNGEIISFTLSVRPT